MPNLPPLEWDGFDPPFYTQVPDALFDVLLPYLSDPELRVLLYVIRRTFGFKKSTDDISLKQITQGIVKRDGERLDYGAGVSKPAAIKAVRGLEAKGIIVTQRNQSTGRGDEATTYALIMRATVLTALTPRVNAVNTGGKRAQQDPVNDIDTQETVVQNTENKKDESNHIPSQFVMAVADDFSRELGDAEHSAANMAQANHLWVDSGLGEEEFVALMQEARKRTRRAQGGQGASKIQNRAAYYFQVLRGLLSGPPGN